MRRVARKVEQSIDIDVVFDAERAAKFIYPSVKSDHLVLLTVSPAAPSDSHVSQSTAASPS